MRRPIGFRRGNRGEAGSFLVVIMVTVAISSIALGAVAQAWSVRLRRDKEEELIFRAQQYVKAILAYRKEHGGQFPTNLEDLFKPGPRQLRYIRRLYKDPLARDGRWGLLYLVPGGRAIVDVVVAQQAQQQKESQWGGDWETAGDAPKSPGGLRGGGPQPGGAPLGGLQKGITAIGGGMLGGGPQGGAGGTPIAAPQMPIALPPIPKVDPSSLDEDSVSEPPIGWPIVGVVSRSGLATGAAESGKGAAGEAAGGSKSDDSDRTFKIYKGHDKISDWQFHVFDFGAELPQAPAAGGQQAPNLGGPIGPGHGGKGTFRLGPGGPQPQGGRRGVPGFNRKGEGWQPGTQGGQQNQGQDKGNDPDDD